MKFREKAEKEHPECIDKTGAKGWWGGVRGCPDMYGYEAERTRCPHEYDDLGLAEGCKKCWDRQSRRR